MRKMCLLLAAIVGLSSIALATPPSGTDNIGHYGQGHFIADNDMEIWGDWYGVPANAYGFVYVTLEYQIDGVWYTQGWDTFDIIGGGSGEFDVTIFAPSTERAQSLSARITAELWWNEGNGWVVASHTGTLNTTVYADSCESSL